MSIKRNFAITHVKADFDAIASAWAAMRLFDCEAILISTLMEPNVEAFLGKGSTLLVRHMKPADIEALDNIGRLIITDCKQVRRLGSLTALLHKAEHIIIYDHHVNYAKDISNAEENLSQVGSCTSILVKELIAKNIEISPHDATLYLLGIYEDTGMLTFSSTTPEDVRMVAHLIEAGGDVSMVSDYVKRELAREQVFILNELLINMTTLTINGINISYSFASIDEYIDELAFLTHRMMEMENLDSLFILVRAGAQIILIGRSKNSMVDTAKIAARFGGGGHTQAASAIIRDMELHETVDVLLQTLREEIQPIIFVKEIMSSPARHLSIDTPFSMALDFALKHNLNHMPITRDGKTVGILSRKDILQGIKHGFTDEPVSLLMQDEIEILTPDTPFRIAEDIMVSRNQKLLPIESDDRLVGVLSRTDIISLMHEEARKRSAYEEGAKTRLGLSRTRNVTDILNTELSPQLYAWLSDIGGIAAEEGMGLYLVGGFVRDLLMGKANPADVDLVAEGDAPRVAARFAAKYSGHLTVHDKYKTATVTLPSGDRIDFATARTEFYADPGASPLVEASSLKSDLTRRDFTINAMAIRIDKEAFGMLLDYFGGQRDILDKKIRVLHSLSFVDDPSRAFRALRFASRFGFQLGAQTEKLMKHAERLGLFAKISGGRMFLELKYILSEDSYLRTIELLKKYNMLNFVAEGLSLDDFRKDQFAFSDEIWQRYCGLLSTSLEIWRVRFIILMTDYGPEELKKILAKLNLEGNIAAKLCSICFRSRQIVRQFKQSKAYKPSDIYRAFAKLDDEEILTAAVQLGRNRSDIVVGYLEHYRSCKTLLNGEDLKAMGIPASAFMGQLLNELLDARLNGIVTTKNEEEQFVRNRFNDLQKEL